MKLLGFNERIDYVIGMCLAPEHDIVTLDGISCNGWWYIGHRLSTGETIKEVYSSLEDIKFDFGDLGKFCFPNNTIKDVRRKDLIEGYEQRHGKDSAKHIEEMIAMPWEQIWKTVIQNRPYPIVLKRERLDF